MKTSACRSKAFKLTNTPFYNKLKLTTQAIRLQITMIYILQFTLVSIVSAKWVLSWRTVVTPYVGIALTSVLARPFWRGGCLFTQSHADRVRVLQDKRSSLHIDEGQSLLKAGDVCSSTGKKAL